MDSVKDDNLTQGTIDVVSAFLSHNTLSAEQVPNFIKQVRGALGYDFPETERAGPGASQSTIRTEPFKIPEGSDPVKATVFPDHIICLEDGAKLKMLKRHLETYHNLSPAQYRKKHGLPKTYPMVAPDYAAARSKLAKEIGLGKPQRKAPARKSATQEAKAS